MIKSCSKKVNGLRVEIPNDICEYLDKNSQTVGKFVITACHTGGFSNPCICVDDGRIIISYDRGSGFVEDIYPGDESFEAVQKFSEQISQAIEAVKLEMSPGYFNIRIRHPPSGGADKVWIKISRIMYEWIYDRPKKQFHSHSGGMLLTCDENMVAGLDKIIFQPSHVDKWMEISGWPTKGPHLESLKSVLKDAVIVYKQEKKIPADDAFSNEKYY